MFVDSKFDQTNVSIFVNFAKLNDDLVQRKETRNINKRGDYGFLTAEYEYLIIKICLNW